MSEVDQGVRCLFLLLDDRGVKNWDDTSGFTLLPQAFTNDHPEVAEYFSTIRLPVISKALVKTSLPKGARNYMFNLLEAKVNIESPKTEGASISSPLPPVRISMNYKNLSIKDNRGCFSFNAFIYSDSKDIRYTEPMSQEFLEVIEEFLKEKCCIGYLHQYGGLIIDFAVKRRQVELVKLLLRYKPFGSASFKTDSGRVLCIAVCKGLHEIAEMLIEYGVNFEDALDYVYDPNRRIYGYGEDTTAFERLLQFGVEDNPHIIPKYLRKFVECDRHDVFDLILSYCPDVTCAFNQTTFHIAFLYHEGDSNYRYYYEKMKDYGFRIEYNNIESYGLLLLGAIMNNWCEVVQKLIEGGADVSQVYEMPEYLCHLKLAEGTFHVLYGNEKYTPLYVAVVYAGEAVIKLLHQHLTDASAEIADRKLISDAIQSCNVDGVRFLIDNGANVRHEPNLICHAIQCSHPKIVELLLLNRTPSNLEDAELARLVSLAMTEVSEVEVLKVLCKFGTQLKVDFTYKYVNKGGDRHAVILRTLLEHNFTVSDCDFAKKLILTIDREYFKYFCDREYFADCRKVLLHHIIQHYTAIYGCPIEDNILHLDRTPTPLQMVFTDLTVSCTAEVRRLKSETVGDSGFTFHDVLTKDVHQLARYAKHYDFVETMGKEDYRNDFPCYASILSCQFEKGARRRYLLDRGSEICSFLSLGFKKLRDADVIEDIIKHLNNYNLEVLNYEFERYLAGMDKM